MPTPSIVIVQRFTYRDKDEEFSNRYHFAGGEPANAGEWHDLADGLIATLKPMFKFGVSFVRAYGYHQDGTGHPSVYQLDYEAPGETVVTGTLSDTDLAAPGDAAMFCQWDTGRLNSRNKKIYLRKYYHGVLQDSTDRDKVSSNQYAALGTMAAALLTDMGDGVRTLAGPDGAAPINSAPNQWITTRTLKRRGKRPNP